MTKPCFELNSEIVKFWTKSGAGINKKQVQASYNPLIIHYVGETENSGYPKLSDIVAFEFHDGDIKYRWNNKNYPESEMLRMINLKAFI